MTAPTTDSRTFRKTLCKFTGTAGSLAAEYNRGVKAALSAVLTSGDDDYWTEVSYRPDGNGQNSWYVDLHSWPPDWPESPFSEGRKGEVIIQVLTN